MRFVSMDEQEGKDNGLKIKTSNVFYNKIKLINSLLSDQYFSLHLNQPKHLSFGSFTNKDASILLNSSI
jgi:hypothetical protein